MNLIDKLIKNKTLEKHEFIEILRDSCLIDYAKSEARKITFKNFGNKIYLRGLIEFTNYCKNNCYYCGIRASNDCVDRYRLTAAEILTAADNGYNLGFRTFVLQGGEDPKFSVTYIAEIISILKNKYSDCAVTLSIGEKKLEEYKLLKEAGADRFLLRHETANEEHYKKLHPKNMSLENRKECLFNLKKLGFQTGTGFMVGSPYQTDETIAADLLFIKQLNPEMVGIGPFLPQKDTPFGKEKQGSVEKTLFLISIIRIMLPYALIPATTALGTAKENGRISGILAGANVLMPNLSPLYVRKKYTLYDNKIATGEEAAESVEALKTDLQKNGYQALIDRGDYKNERNEY